jgi:2-(3-amino-3-carboxypropyl)histidine synthase
MEAGPSKPTPRKRFVGTSKPSRAPIRRVANQIPDDILHDPKLNQAIAGGWGAFHQDQGIGRLTLTALPGNYKFEVHKTIHHIRRDGIKTVALQMPEGLMVYGCAIADIIEE